MQLLVLAAVQLVCSLLLHSALAAGPCVFNLNGTVYNLTKLSESNIERTLQYDGFAFAYTLRVCDVVTGTKCNELPDSQPTVCQEYSTMFGQSLGDLRTQNVSLWEEGDMTGVLFEYSNGTMCSGLGPRRTSIEIMCDYSESEVAVIDSVDEGITCSYVVRMRSRYACPSLCEEGFAGIKCDSCLNGYYGPKCTRCDCKHGTCQDGVSGSGACVCDNGWSGPKCAECSPIKCAIKSPNGRFEYDLALIAQDDNDYTFSDNANFEYWINPLAPLSAPCAGQTDQNNIAACQRTAGRNGRDISLGQLTTQTTSMLSTLQSDGVILTYGNGTLCDNPDRARTFSLKLVCNRQMNVTERMRLVNVEELPSRCVYSFNMEGAQACPICQKDVPRFGPECEPCSCFRGTCASGIESSGICSCEENWTGAKCDECASNRFGDNCDKLCTCDTDRAKCDAGRTGTGNCVCFAGWTGKECDAGLFDVSLVMKSGSVGAAIGVLVGAALVAVCCAYYVKRSGAQMQRYESLP